MRQFFSRYPNGDNFAAHIVKKFALEPVKAHVRAIDGLLRYVRIKNLFELLIAVSKFRVSWSLREFFDYIIHCDYCRSGPTVAEAFIKEGKAASKAAASGMEY